MFNSETRYVQKFLGDAGLSKIAREYMLTNAVPNRLRDMANVELQKYLRRPKSVTVSADGRLFISDNLSYRLQVYQKEVIHLTPEQYGPPMRSPYPQPRVGNRCPFPLDGGRLGWGVNTQKSPIPPIPLAKVGKIRANFPLDA